MDRSEIVDAALALSQEAGLDALSFRNLAARLGVKAPSLYWHVSDKRDLLAAMGEKLLWQCLEQMPEVDNWQGWLYAYGRQLWLTELSVRDSGTLMMSLHSSAAGTERMNAEIVKRLAKFGVPPPNATVMQWSVQTLMTGTLAVRHVTFSKDPAFVGAVFDNLESLIAGWSVRCANGFPKLDYMTADGRGVNPSALP